MFDRLSQIMEQTLQQGLLARNNAELLALMVDTLKSAFGTVLPVVMASVVLGGWPMSA